MNELRSSAASAATILSGLAAAALLALAICWAIEASIRVRLGGPNAWQLFGFFLVLESFAIAMTTALLALRWLGFRLLLGKNAEPIPADYS